MIPLICTVRSTTPPHVEYSQQKGDAKHVEASEGRTVHGELKLTICRFSFT